MTQPYATPPANAADIRATLAALEAERRRRQWERDPVLWARERLGVDLWSKQREIVEAVRDHRHVAVRSSFDTGKCLEENERLTLADGRVVVARDLVGRFFALPAFAEDGRQTPALAWATDNGEQDVWRITTRSGRQIVRTGNHPLMAGSRPAPKYGTLVKPSCLGWKHCEKLKTGDLVMVPDALRVEGRRSVPDAEVKLLGYLLGDGCLRGAGAVGFTQQDGEALEEFKSVVYDLGCAVVERKKLAWSVVGKHDGPNHVLDLTRKWGIYGVLSKRKSFPSWAWELPNTQLAMLVNRIFACDGWVCIPSNESRRGRQGSNVSIGICLASERLLRDVELALLRLGINGTVRQRFMSSSKGGEKKFSSWELVITRLADLERFRDLVGIVGKQEKLVRACNSKIGTAKSTKRGGHAWKWQQRECPEGYHWDVVAVVEHLGRRRTVCISVETYHTFVSAFVEHNSFVAGAVLACWWIDVHPPGTAFCVTSASTEAQVKAILWHEIAKSHARGRLIGRLNQTEWWVNVNGVEQMVGFGRKPADTNATAFQGLHRKYVLVILDEAAGIPISLWDAAEGLVSNEYSRLLAIGNPEDPLSQFAEVCKPGSGWHSIKISAFDTPAYTGEKVSQALLDVLVSRTWVEERKRRWGEDNPKYIAKVTGEFPEIVDNCLILPSWVLAAQERTLTPMRPAELGVDVGAGGDRTVIAHRQGPVVRIVHRGRQRNTMEACGDVVNATRKYGAETVKIDEIGVGKGIADRTQELHLLRELNTKIIPINVGKAADRKMKRKGKREIDEHDESEQFLNRRAQGYWHLRELFQYGEIDIDPNDEDLAAQLVDIQYERLSNGTIKIESKEEMKRRKKAKGGDGESPDEADAVMLAFMDAASLKTVSATWGSSKRRRR